MIDGKGQVALGQDNTGAAVVYGGSRTNPVDLFLAQQKQERINQLRKDLVQKPNQDNLGEANITRAFYKDIPYLTKRKQEVLDKLGKAYDPKIPKDLQIQYMQEAVEDKGRLLAEIAKSSQDGKNILGTLSRINTHPDAYDKEDAMNKIIQHSSYDNPNDRPDLLDIQMVSDSNAAKELLSRPLGGSVKMSKYDYDKGDGTMEVVQKSEFIPEGAKGIARAYFNMDETGYIDKDLLTRDGRALVGRMEAMISDAGYKKGTPEYNRILKEQLEDWGQTQIQTAYKKQESVLSKSAPRPLKNNIPQKESKQLKKENILHYENGEGELINEPYRPLGIGRRENAELTLTIPVDSRKKIGLEVGDKTIVKGEKRLGERGDFIPAKIKVKKINGVYVPVALGITKFQRPNENAMDKRLVYEDVETEEPLINVANALQQEGIQYKWAIEEADRLNFGGEDKKGSLNP